MSIKRIKSISDIGSFCNFHETSDDFAFDKFNVFFGDNGNGKTTLSAIFQSLNEGNPNLILQRKRFSCEKEPECVLEMGDETYVFKDHVWKNRGQILTPLSKFIAFNDSYVKRNFFSDKFEHRHKVKMHKIIFGEKGIEINDKLTDLKKDIDDLKSKIGIGNMVKISEIFEIPEKEYPSYSDKLNTIESKIENIKQKQQISIQKEPSLLPKINLNLSELKIMLNLKIDSASHISAKTKMLEYKKDYFELPEQYENFIDKGLKNIKNENCPFCHKKLDVVGILDTYRAYFDKQYDELKSKLNLEIKKTISINFPLIVNNLESVEKLNQNIMDYWSPKIGSFPIQKIIFSNILELKRILDSELNEKSNNPNYEFKKEVLNNLEEKTLEINSFIDIENKKIEEYGIKIKEFKKDLGVINIDEILEKRDEIKLIIERFTVKKAFFNKLFKKKGEEASLKEELEKYTSSTSQNYLNSINQKLLELGISEIKLKEVKSVKHTMANEVSTEITLTINNCDIQMKSDSDEIPAFNNTLSGGEKNALSFAFFMAELEKVENLEEQIIIFDDPLTSLDDNRKGLTVKMINSLENKVSQIIILTHKSSFLSKLNKEIPGAKFFELKKDLLNGSKIFLLDIKEKFKTDYAKIIDRLYSFTQVDFEYSSLGNDLRKAFETLISIKYYIKRKNISSTLVTYNTFEEMFWSQGKLLEEKIDICSILNISNEQSHLEGVSELVYSDMNYQEKRIWVEKALQIMEKI